MSKPWPERPLAELCEFRNGLWKGKKPPYVHVGVIRNTNFNADGSLDDSDIAFLDVEEKQFSKRQLQFGDLILEKSGGGPRQPVGRVIAFNKTEGSFSFSNFTSAIRVLDPSLLDFRYLHRLLYWYYVSGITEGMQRRSTGIRNLDFGAYKQLPVPVPPRPEQERIVAILDEAFAAIATATANAERNLANARELFESYVHRVFEGLEGTVPAQTLAQVCAGITVGHVGSMASRYVESGVPFLRSKNVRPFEVSLEDLVYIDADFHNSLRKSSLRPGDLVVVRTGYPGTAAVIPKTMEEANCSDLVVIHLGPDVDPYYLCLLFNSTFGQSLVGSRLVGTAQKHFNVTEADASPDSPAEATATDRRQGIAPS